jgi:Fur family ferric uptake transcriptional regulator
MTATMSMGADTRTGGAIMRTAAGTGMGMGMGTRTARTAKAKASGMGSMFRWRRASAMARHDPPRDSALERWQERFRAAMEKGGRRITRQRLFIAGLLYEMRGHPTIGELRDELGKTWPGAGLATIYRTLRLLKDVGLAMELRGNGGVVRFEAVDTPRHHDHLVCRKCGAVLEICSPELERAQSALARAHGFFPEEEAHCIHGVCSACRKML